MRDPASAKVKVKIEREGKKEEIQKKRRGEIKKKKFQRKDQGWAAITALQVRGIGSSSEASKTGEIRLWGFTPWQIDERINIGYFRPLVLPGFSELVRPSGRGK
jgi:hypothetical protein